MVKVRLVPVMLLREGMLVKSYQFKRFLPVGSPLNSIKFFNQWDVDEIVFLDITPGKSAKVGRLDDNYQRFDSLADYTQYISKHCFVPLTVGGGIKSLKDMEILFKAGADKVSVNTLIHESPQILQQAAERFGKQALVASIDVKQRHDGKDEVVTGYGKEVTGFDAVSWAKKVEAWGAGEILLNSIDRDGMMNGYDIQLARAVTGAVKIPVIASGGAGNLEDCLGVIKEGRVSALAAASIFQYTQITPLNIKEYLAKFGVETRVKKL